MCIILNEGQKKAVELAVKKVKAGDDVVIAGYAGTGKSTTVSKIIEKLTKECGISNVVYVAFAGKAVKVLREKGNDNAITCHRLLYKPVLQEDGTYKYELVDDIDYDLIVADECSMIPSDMVNQMRSFGKPIIWLGDPFQLPPVENENSTTSAGNTLLQNPDVFLTEIMRQANDSEIINAGLKLRNLEKLNYGIGREFSVISKDRLNDRTLLWADEIICATNRKRTEVNNYVRRLKKFSALPQIGDKVICLHNYYEHLTNNDEMIPLTNGTIGIIVKMEEELWTAPKSIADKLTVTEVPCYRISIKTDLGFYNDLLIDKNELINGMPTISGKDLYLIKKKYAELDKAKISHKPFPLDFNYGYAITCHKAQGSEWDNIVVMEEWFPNDLETHCRWLYTALTRASEKVVIVR